jgi:tRNA pseudouridine55 synthase
VVIEAFTGDEAHVWGTDLLKTGRAELPGLTVELDEAVVATLVSPQGEINDPLELVALEGERLVLDIHCSKGTYIRTLAEDIGEALGCGASLSALERTGVQPFWEDRRYTLDELRAIREQQGDDALLDCLLPIEAALREWPEVTLSSAMSFYLKQGQPVQVPGAPLEGLVRLCGESEGFLGVGQILGDGRVAPKRLLRAKS